jgi:hypothetical protein
MEEEKVKEEDISPIKAAFDFHLWSARPESGREGQPLDFTPKWIRLLVAAEMRRAPYILEKQVGNRDLAENVGPPAVFAHADAPSGTPDGQKLKSGPGTATPFRHHGREPSLPTKGKAGNYQP